MLVRDSWLPLAQRLSLEDGRSRRVDHDCGSGRTLLLSREGAKLKAHCFRCNDGDSFAIEEPLHARIARLNAVKAAELEVSASQAPPEGVSDPSQWPTPARLWLAKAGLHSGDVGALRARYDPRTNRVVLPLSDTYWQARALAPGQMPKYLAPAVGRQHCIPAYGSADRITLTEDVLSAYKVGQVAQGWCMLGTSMSPLLLSKILASGKPVNVWLDNDLPPLHQVNRGQIAARKVVSQLRASGVSVRNIVAPKDPKLMTYQQIKELLL